MVGAVATVPNRDSGFTGRLASGKNVTGFPVDNGIAIGCAAFVVKYSIAGHNGFYLTTCFSDLTDVEGIKFGGHTGLDEAPFHLVAVGQDGREGENENILDRIFYGGISTFINLLDAAHAILETGEVMLEGKVFGLIGQLLDRVKDCGPGVGGGLGGGGFLLL
jgi:hypothetical protein